MNILDMLSSFEGGGGANFLGQMDLGGGGSFQEATGGKSILDLLKSPEFQKAVGQLQLGNGQNNQAPPQQQIMPQRRQAPNVHLPYAFAPQGLAAQMPRASRMGGLGFGG